ncbi:NUDIX domain-containing protein [Streptomyces sp. NBC_01537]|uniref:NUDIX domain-containing protein n=1 Tax=Streptomyces sp. NBC_01537 TaxID=2903896 RepID=UPI00386FD8BD
MVPGSVNDLDFRLSGVEPDRVDIAEDGVEWSVISDGHEWRVAWHPPPDPPPGTGHGSAGICVVGDRAVLVTSDGRRWGLPGGRPEPGEDWLATLRREVGEEACATVVEARLLGYSRGACLQGPEAGLVLVRSLWLAQVTLDPWEPRFEMTARQLVPAGEAPAFMWIADGFAQMYQRMFAEAALATETHERPGGGMSRCES